MQRKFITNLALLLVLNLLIKPFWVLGIEVAVQHAVGTSTYGMYYALFNFSFLLNILLDVGITNFNNKNIAQNNHLLQKHLSSIIVLRMCLAVLYFSITIIAGFIIGYNFLQLQMVGLLAFNQVLISFILYLRSNIAGLHLFKTDSFISVLDRLIMISICAFLLWGNVTKEPFQISWFIYAQTSAYLLTVLITLVIVLDRAKLKRLNWDWPFFLMILKKSYPYAVLVLLMTFYNRIDTVMLERLLGEEGARQSGIYASAYRLLDAANMIAFLFSGLLLPIFAKMIKQKESVEDLVRLAFSLLIVPAVVVAIGSCFYRYELMKMFYMKDVVEAAAVFGLLMFCFVAISTTYIFGTLLTSNGNLKELNYMAAGGMIINISLNIILIPRFLAVGSAMSSLVTQFLSASVQVLLVQKIFKFKINYRLIASFLAFCLGVAIINYFSRSIGFHSGKWMLNFIGMIAASFLLAFSIRLISLKGIYNILLNK